MSLRRRLVAGMLFLLVAAIVTTDAVTESSLRGYLSGQIDERIDAAEDQVYAFIVRVYDADVRAGDPVATQNPAAWLALVASPAGARARLGRADGTGFALDQASLDDHISPDAYVELVDRAGLVVYRRPSGLPSSPDPAPVLPTHLRASAPGPRHFGSRAGPYAPDPASFEMAAAGTAAPFYRAQAIAIPGGTLVTALPLAPMQATLSRLTHVELIVSVLVVLVLVLLTLWIVGIGLRPLEAMTETAAAIAGGDLARRVGTTDDRGEVGRLGQALNQMLGHIENAFRQTTASEARLRRFVADASHELRTPLTSVRGYAELLRKEALGDEASRRRAADRIEREAARMSKMVDELLLLARLDQNRPLELSPTDLTQIVADSVGDATTVDDTRHYRLERPPAPVVVAGDADRLRQAVDNLLRNAQDHTPPGTTVGVRVTVVPAEGAPTGPGGPASPPPPSAAASSGPAAHRSPRAGDGSVARVEVADDGPGLSEEHALRVYDRFFRADAARTGSGTGLGLSITAAIVTAHGGRCGVRARLGDGATFWFEVPAGASTGPADRAGARAAARPAGATDPPGGPADMDADEDADEPVVR